MPRCRPPNGKARAQCHRRDESDTDGATRDRGRARCAAPCGPTVELCAVWRCGLWYGAHAGGAWRFAGTLGRRRSTYVDVRVRPPRTGFSLV